VSALNFATALIVGAGAGLSASLARALTRDGIRVALAARSTGDLEALTRETGARAFTCDAAVAAQVEKLFAEVEAACGAPDIVIYNASFRARGPFIELDPAAVERSIAVSAFGAFLVAQQAARRMLPKRHGAILFTGASASVKGFAQSAPFAMGKFALRGLAQSMARELGPQGIHVAHMVIERSPQMLPTACSIPMRSRRPILTSFASRAAPGPPRSSCGRGWKNSEFRPAHGPIFRREPGIQTCVPGVTLMDVSARPRGRACACAHTTYRRALALGAN